MLSYKMRLAGSKSGEVYLYDEIGSGYFGGISAKQFADDLNALGKIDTLNVRINSPGGDVFDGLAIYNTMKRHPAYVNIDIDGMALSIASIIAMAGDTVRMADNAMFMIHDPWTMVAGSADDFRKQADLMDQVKENLVSTYQKRTSMDNEVLSQMMTDETWMDATTAKQWGFVDEITDQLQIAASFDLRRFKNTPKMNRTAPNSNIYRAKIAAMKKRVSG